MEAISSQKTFVLTSVPVDTEIQSAIHLMCLTAFWSNNQKSKGIKIRKWFLVLKLRYPPGGYFL